MIPEVLPLPSVGSTPQSSRIADDSLDMSEATLSTSNPPSVNQIIAWHTSPLLFGAADNCLVARLRPSSQLVAFPPSYPGIFSLTHELAFATFPSVASVQS